VLSPSQERSTGSSCETLLLNRLWAGCCLRTNQGLFHGWLWLLEFDLILVRLWCEGCTLDVDQLLSRWLWKSIWKLSPVFEAIFTLLAVNLQRLTNNLQSKFAWSLVEMRELDQILTSQTQRSLRHFVALLLLTELKIKSFNDLVHHVNFGLLEVWSVFNHIEKLLWGHFLLRAFRA